MNSIHKKKQNSVLLNKVLPTVCVVFFLLWDIVTYNTELTNVVTNTALTLQQTPMQLSHLGSGFSSSH